MSKESITNILFLFLLLALQVLIFNHMNFLGYANPMIHLLFIIKYPYREKRLFFILLSFLLGLGIDIFSDTGGLFATSTLIVCYIRPTLLKFCFSKNLEYQKLKLLSFSPLNLALYVTLIILTHNSFFYFLEVFNFVHLTAILIRITVTSILTFIFCYLFIYLFDRKEV